MANCGRMVRDSAMLTMGSFIRETVITLSRVVPFMTLYDFPYPKMGVPSAPLLIRWISNGHISETDHRSTLRFVLEQGFRGGRRIEWSYFRFDQIQYGSRPPSWKITAASHEVSLRQRGFLVNSRLGGKMFVSVVRPWMSVLVPGPDTLQTL